MRLRLPSACGGVMAVTLLLAACATPSTPSPAPTQPTSEVLTATTPLTATEPVTTTAAMTGSGALTESQTMPTTESLTASVGELGEQIAQIDSGLIEGTLADSVLSFKGIPYAAPPLGDLRWRAPQPVTPWTGVRQTTAFGADCAQAPGDVEKIQTTPSEVCLFVNVWRPSEIEPRPEGARKLPVMVWIHGGGFVGGGASIPWYDGSAFARQGMVVISLNYRLGRLGFFAHPALLAAQEGPVGNFGFMDQIAALQWVQRNAAAFGGDPQQVTLVGQSAGGASVLALLTSPVTTGLFQQVVVL
nr:carboxylesterase family protein [Caldilineaceae bacterium]